MRAHVLAFCREHAEDANCAWAVQSLPEPGTQTACSATFDRENTLFQMRCPTSLVLSHVGKIGRSWVPLSVWAFRVYPAGSQEFATAAKTFVEHCKSSDEDSCSEVLGFWNACPGGEYTVGAGGDLLLEKDCAGTFAFITLKKDGNSLSVKETELRQNKSFQAGNSGQSEPVWTL